MEEPMPGDAANRGRGSILFLSHTSAIGGGAEVVLEQMLDASRRFGYLVMLAAPDGELIDRIGPTVEAASRIVLVPPRRTSHPTQAFKLVVALVGFTLRFVRLLRKRRPTVLYANSGTAALAATVACQVTGTPLIWHQHDIVPPRRVNRLALRYVGSTAVRVVAVSQAVAASLSSLGVSRRKLAVLHNAVRPEFFEPLVGREEARERLSLPGDANILAMAGRMVPYKGHRLFLESIAELHRRGFNVTGVVAGDVPAYGPNENDPFPGYREELQGRAARPDLAGRIVFLGHQEDIRTLLGALDVLVVPSEGEPFPLVVLEGLAAGVPVLASDSGGHPEAIDDGVTGLLFKSGNLGSLIEGETALVEDEGRRTLLARRGRETAVARFSIHRFETEFHRILDSVLGRG